MKKIYNSPTIVVIAISTTALLNGSIYTEGDNAKVNVDVNDYGEVFNSREYDFDEDEY